MNIIYFVEEFAKAVQSDTIKNEHDAVSSVKIGDFELFFAYFEQRNTIMLHASIYEHDGSKEYLAHLLQMNNFFSKTHGICLGIDGNIVTAQLNVFMIDEEQSTKNLELFMAQSKLFLVNLPQILEYLKTDFEPDNNVETHNENILNPTLLV